jgi:uncharacterized protein with PIN domain
MGQRMRPFCPQCSCPNCTARREEVTKPRLPHRVVPRRRLEQHRRYCPSCKRFYMDKEASFTYCPHDGTLLLKLSTALAFLREPDDLTDNKSSV